MPTSFRLDPETDALLQRLAEASGRSKSWLVREALALYSTTSPHARSPYELMAPYIGAGGTGLTNGSERTGEALAAVVREKVRARRSR
jgi:predicted DNA-binding protein